MRILIADDGPTNLKVLRLTLKGEGHIVLEAADGAEALKILATEKVDLVISDILMPNMDGYRLCHDIRHNPLLRQLPIILYSSTYLTANDRKLAMDFGANGFLEKPASAENLRRTIESAVRCGAPVVAAEAPEDTFVLKQYSERLIKKIEEKNHELARRTGELEEAQSKFRQMAENMGEVFWMSTLKVEKFLYVSPAYESIWGRPLQELYDDPKAWFNAIHPEDQPAVLAAITEERYAAEKGYEDEWRILRPDGTIRWILNRSFPIRDVDGKIYRVTGICADITARKNLEDQFRQSQKMDAVGRLAGGVAHDFNNLLTVINGYSQLLMARLDKNDPAYLDVEEINKAGVLAAALTRQLLTFSRKQVLRPQVISLNTSIREMEKLLRRLIGEDVTLITKLSNDLGNVKIDQSQFEQVIVNLAVNAKDAMPRGGRLSIETINIDIEESNASVFKGIAAGAYVQIAVTDSGTGMSGEVKNRLFEPFFTTKEIGKGTGLGLSTVYGIVKQSSGHINVYSEVGKGTCFKLYIPRVEDRSASRIRLASKPRLSKGVETVLVVEDVEVVRKYIGTVLRASGYTVREASHGDEALVIIEGWEGPIDLVLTDMVMPEMSGPELVRRIAKVRPDTKIMYMSGYPDSEVVHQGAFDPDAPFLDKPFSPDSLLRKVREVLDTADVGRPSGA